MGKNLAQTRQGARPQRKNIGEMAVGKSGFEIHNPLRKN
jgi:hypothetical protein